MGAEEINYFSLYFFILLAISGMIHHFYKKSAKIATSDGSIVMAIGIFSLDALQTLPFVTQTLTQLIAVQLLIIWLYLANHYIRQYRQGGFTEIPEHKISQFGIGTWVASSAVLAILFLQTFPALSWIIWASAFVALITWFGYIIISSYNFWLIIFRQLQLHTGILLLPTVSTQSIALLIYSLFVATVPPIIYQILIISGYLFYVIAIFIIIKHDFLYRHRYFILNWNNANSIIHGALSISGLASVSTQVINDKVILCTWFLSTCFLLVNESVSIIKSIYRIKAVGFLRGIIVYDGSQWARIFTLGMYYAFNRALLEHQVYSNFFIEDVVHYGQYAILLILLFEIFNYLRWCIDKCDTKTPAIF